MNEKSAKVDRFNWRLPIYAAIGALVVFWGTSFFRSDAADLLYIVVCIVISLLLLVIGTAAAIGGKPRQSLAIVSILIILWGVSWLLLRNGEEVRSEVRWLWNSKTYKAQVLAQPVPANGNLKHIEWDGWGFPGAGDTIVYLVFDPTDALAAAARNYVPHKFNGIPCEVSEVHRLEKDWYAVFFFTDTAWDHCA